MVYRNNTGRLGCWLHQCVLRNTLAGSKTVVSTSRDTTVWILFFFFLSVFFILKIGLFIVLVILFALHLVEIFNLLFRFTIFGCFGSTIEAIVVHYPKCLKMQDQHFFCASYRVDLHWKCVAKNTWIMLSSCYHHVVTYPLKGYVTTWGGQEGGAGGKWRGSHTRD